MIETPSMLFFVFGVWEGLVLGISCVFSGVNVELGKLVHGMVPGLDGNSFQGGKEVDTNPVQLLYGKPM